MSSGKSLTEFKVSNDLVKSCRLAHSRYVKAMEDFKKAKVNNEKNRKRRLKMNEIVEVTEKKRAIESCTKSLEPDIESSVLLLQRKVICPFLPKQTLFAILFVKRKLISELDCALEKLNDEIKHI